MAQTALERFKSQYAYGELVKKHKMDEYGFWKIRGADNNPDFGGSHYQADLGTFEGKLEDIINYAVTLPGFWSWGSGDIDKVNKPIKIDAQSSARRIKVEQRIKELKQSLKDAEEELKSI
jgi:hypothetical protein